MLISDFSGNIWQKNGMKSDLVGAKSDLIGIGGVKVADNWLTGFAKWLFFFWKPLTDESFSTDIL